MEPNSPTCLFAKNKALRWSAGSRSDGNRYTIIQMELEGQASALDRNNINPAGQNCGHQSELRLQGIQKKINDQ